LAVFSAGRDTSWTTLSVKISLNYTLISRPFKTGDAAGIAGEERVVDDVSTLFTIIVKNDGSRVLIPNSAIINAKIYLKPKTQ
jgi:small-conductance mechanosensitive channel